MISDTNRFEQAIAVIDAANARDPNKTTPEGSQSPPEAEELAYSRRLSAWLDRLDANASEALRLAVRSQHLCRWEIPRSSYPMTRAGYHQWRTRLGAFHAERAGEILRSVGYDDDFIARVGSLIRKERFKTDPEAQTLEDAACLVFLEMEYVEFAKKHQPEKVIEIVRKTWRKMSDRGHELALEMAGALPDAERELLVMGVSEG